MPSAHNKVVHLRGPWKGLMEWPAECSNEHVEDAYNVEFEGNVIRQRPGRVKFTETSVVRPLIVVHYDTSVVAPVPAILYAPGALDDGNQATVATSMLGDFVHQTIFIGGAFKFSQLAWTIIAGNTNVASLTIQYWNGSAWTTLGLNSDSTIAAGRPFAQTGAQKFLPPFDWRPGGASGTTGLSVFDPSAFYVKITSSANLSVWTASELRLDLDAGGGGIADTRTAVNGLKEFVLRNGERRLMVGMDDLGFTLGGNNYPAYARMFYWDPGSDEFVTVILPDAGKETEPGAFWNFISMNGKLVFTNGKGPLMYYDGEFSPDLVAAVPGNDSLSRGYLGAVPPGRYLAVYRGRLYIMGHRSTPYTVVFSEVESASNNIPNDGSAPLGGANLWPAANNFDVISGEGDAITGGVVQDDRLIIFKRGSYGIWDETQLQIRTGIGAAAPRSIANAGSKYGVFFLADDGVYVMLGGVAHLISYPVQPTLARYLNRGNIEGAIGVVLPKKHQYRLYIPANNHTRNRLCLVYDYVAKTWSKFCGPPPFMSEPDRSAFQELEVSAAVVADAGTDEELLITGDYAGKLWAEDKGILDGATRPFAMVKFKQLGLEDESVKTWRTWRVSMRLTGSVIFAKMLLEDEPFIYDADNPQSVYLNTGADTEVATSPGGPSFGYATYANPGAWTAQANVKGDRFGETKISLGRRARRMQPVIFADGWDSGQDNSYPARFAIRGLDIDYRPRAGRRG